MVSNLVSITNYPDIFMCMTTDGIGAYVKRLREERGFTQRRLAELAETSSAYISQIEGGKVSLPGADMRRRLSAALGVSNLDMLVAAGEISPAEVQKSGMEGVVHQDGSPKARVHAAVEALAWNESEADQAIAMFPVLRVSFTPRIDPAKYDRKLKE